MICRPLCNRQAVPLGAALLRLGGLWTSWWSSPADLPPPKKNHAASHRLDRDTSPQNGRAGGPPFVFDKFTTTEGGGWGGWPSL
jgi:hypothetical protein